MYKRQKKSRAKPKTKSQRDKEDTREQAEENARSATTVKGRGALCVSTPERCGERIWKTIKKTTLSKVRDEDPCLWYKVGDTDSTLFVQTNDTND